MPATATISTYSKLERKMTPGLRYSQDTYADVLDEIIQPETRWVDVGCGHSVLPEWRPDSELKIINRAHSIIGVDIDREAAAKHRSIRDIRIGSIYDLPLENDSADIVTANMVLEHLEYPSQAFSEVGRILRAGGKLLVHTPNLLGYIAGNARLLPPSLRRGLAVLLEGRHEEDVYRTYYRCNTERAIRKAAGNSGLEVDRVQHISTNAAFQLIIPMAVLELAWIRITMTQPFARLRTNIIAVLSKTSREAELL
jgi:SAM-dependent methyltransferase